MTFEFRLRLFNLALRSSHNSNPTDKIRRAETVALSANVLIVKCTCQTARTVHLLKCKLY